MPEANTAELEKGISRPLVLLLATTAGAAVANLYYAQPLLHTIARAFSVSNRSAGLLVTVTQAGYVVGLALLVPLGDLLERRRLIAASLIVAAGALGLAAVAPTFALFALAVAILGVSAVVAQIIVAMSSSLATGNERGRVVGTVMSGLLIGILVARTISGVAAELLGWRAVFVIGAAAMLMLAAVLRCALPRVPPTERLRYPQLLRSVLELVRGEPLLRQRMLIGATAFGCFSVLWTSVAFLLAGPPYHYGNAAIGLFGLAGLAGALIAPVAGRLSDRGHGRLAMTGSIFVLLASWGVLAFGNSSVVALIVGIVLLDLGAQAMHISNQSAIYTLHGQARSRLTTAYMVSYFLGGVVLSAATSALYATGGWPAVCGLGAGTAAIGLIAWLISEQVMTGRLPLSAERSS
ncbi:MAG: MFS transporter [Solirubrobacterales bacterium]|nr:MFS transporter [Solirubrobacterales bacterium]